MIKRSYLIICIIVLLFSFTACDKDNDSTTTATTTTTKKVTQEQVSYTRVKKTTTTQNTTARKRTVTTTSKSTATTASAAEVATTTVSQYSTINDIANYYNTCINKVKTNSKSVTRNYEEILTLESNLTNGEITSTLISSYFNKGRDSSALICTTYDEKSANFPIAGKYYSSKLEASMVKSASCTYKNGYYNIVISLKDDTDGQNYSSTCLSVVSTDWVSNTCDRIIEKNKMSVSCKNCVIKCIVNASTGNVEYLNTYMPTVVKLTAFEGEQSFSFYIKQDWTISW